MSTVKTDLLTNRLGTKHPAVLKADLTKAWGSANMVGTMVLRQGFGMASITDYAVGIIYFNMTSPMAALGYGTVSASSASTCAACPNNFQNATTSDVTVFNSASGAAMDQPYVNILVNGALA